MALGRQCLALACSTRIQRRYAIPPPSIDIPLLSVSAELHEEVKVNNASATDVKHACDDTLKRFLSRPELFKQIHTHTDVRLALGWLSVLVAGATGLYGWKIPFEQTKPAVWVGVVLYVTPFITQTLSAYFLLFKATSEFAGKQKGFDKRIVAERITSTAKPTPSSPSSPPGYALGLAVVITKSVAARRSDD